MIFRSNEKLNSTCILNFILIIVIMVVATLIGIFIWERVHVSFQEENDKMSISIIGGADGPTSVFVAGKIGQIGI